MCTVDKHRSNSCNLRQEYRREYSLVAELSSAEDSANNNRLIRWVLICSRLRPVVVSIFPTDDHTCFVQRSTHWHAKDIPSVMEVSDIICSDYRSLYYTPDFTNMICEDPVSKTRCQGVHLLYP